MKQLTDTQLILLENLTYGPDNERETGFPPIENFSSVGAYINAIDYAITNKTVNPEHDDFQYVSVDEWTQIVNAIKNDNDLLNIKIKDVHGATVGGMDHQGKAVLFETGQKEKIVAFRGTSKMEWQDNFLGSGKTDAADGVSTEMQLDALKWYDSLFERGLLSEEDYITALGHSKGANKAKYITIVDQRNAINRCISLDGQGFGDEFIDVYGDPIEARQHKIRNLNAESDFVNILLNQVGSEEFFVAANIGAAGFFENHCPNAYLHFDDDGSVYLVEGNKDERLASLDVFFNSYLRTLQGEEKTVFMQQLGALVQALFNNEDLLIILSKIPLIKLFDLLEYYISYCKAHPEVWDALLSLLKEMGVLGTSQAIITALAMNPRGALLLSMIGGLGVARNTPLPSGQDLVVESREQAIIQRYEIIAANINSTEQTMIKIEGKIAEIHESLLTTSKALKGEVAVTKGYCNLVATKINTTENECKRLRTALHNIANEYKATEQRILRFQVGK